MTAASELLTWQNGTPTGGPSGDGRYPLTYKDGVTYLVYCPAAQALNPALVEQPIETFANTASAAATTATTQAGIATTARIDAQTAAANAATSASSALASKNTATTQATAATTAKTAALAAQTAAETARDEAEAAAASFAAGDYVTKATVQTITAAKTMGADFTIQATYNLLLGSQSGGGVGQVRVEHASAARIGFTSTGSRRYTLGTDTSKLTIRDESAGLDRMGIDSAGVVTFRESEVRFAGGAAQFGYSSTTTNYALYVCTTPGGGGLADIRLNNSPTEHRWLLRKNATAESGADVGSDLQLYKYSDAGAASVVLTVTRSTGVVAFNVAPTVAGNAIWHAGTFNPADKLDVTEVAEASTVSKVVKRNSVGDISARLFRGEFGDQTTMSGGLAYRINNSTDNYFRVCNSPAAIKTWLGYTMADVTDLPALSQSTGGGTIAQRNGSGYLYATYFNTTAAFVGATQPTALMVETSSDGFIRKQTPADFKKQTMGIQNVTSAATVTPSTDNDIVAVTAQAVALAIANPTGSTPVQGQGIVIRVKDNGTARAISWGTSYRAMGAALPNTTVANKTMYIPLIYNATDSKWDVLPATREA